MTHRASLPVSFSSALLAALVTVAAVSVTGVAQASDPRTEDLFQGAGVVPPADAKAAREAERAVARVAEVCHAPAGERMGASPTEAAACNAAVSSLVKQGKAATAAILSQLDDQRTPWYARMQIRDALARTGDDAVVAALVKAAERVAAREEGRVPSEVSSNDVQEVLEQITFVNPAEQAPWAAEGKDVKPVDETSKGVAAAWRAWLQKNPVPAGGYRKAGEAQAKQDAASNDVGVAFLAARRLAKHKSTKAAGVAALRKLAGRNDLPAGAADIIGSTLEEHGVSRPAVRVPAPSKVTAPPVAKPTSGPARSLAPSGRLPPSQPSRKIAFARGAGVFGPRPATHDRQMVPTSLVRLAEGDHLVDEVRDDQKNRADAAGHERDRKEEQPEVERLQRVERHERADVLLDHVDDERAQDAAFDEGQRVCKHRPAGVVLGELELPERIGRGGRRRVGAGRRERRLGDQDAPRFRQREVFCWSPSSLPRIAPR